MNNSIIFFKKQIRYYINRYRLESDESYIKKLYTKYVEDVTEDEFLEYPLEIQKWLMSNEHNFINKKPATKFPYNENTKKYLINKKKYVTTIDTIQKLLIDNINLTTHEVLDYLTKNKFKFTKRTASTAYILTKTFINFYNNYWNFKYKEGLPLTVIIRYLIIEYPNEKSKFYLDYLRERNYKFGYDATLKLIYNYKNLLKLLNESKTII
jgi:hypothetical protein